MNKLLLTAIALVASSAAAHASNIPVLDTVTQVGSVFEFPYNGTLAGDTGLVAGNQLVIFDFGGYVTGSISAGIYAADLDAFVEEPTSTSCPRPARPTIRPFRTSCSSGRVRRSTPWAAPSRASTSPA